MPDSENHHDHHEETAKTVGFWSGAVANTSLSIFFSTLNTVSDAVMAVADKALFGAVGSAEVADLAVHGYELGTLAPSEHQDVNDPAYKKKLADTRVKFGVTLIKATLVSVAIFGGIFAGCALIAPVVPILFATAAAVSTVNNLARGGYHFYKYMNAEAGSPEAKKHRDAALSHTFACAVDIALLSGITLAVMTLPISAPIMASVTGAFLGAAVVRKLGPPLYQRLFGTPKQELPHDLPPPSISNPLNLNSEFEQHDPDLLTSLKDEESLAEKEDKQETMEKREAINLVEEKSDQKVMEEQKETVLAEKAEDNNEQNNEEENNNISGG